MVKLKVYYIISVWQGEGKEIILFYRRIINIILYKFFIDG